jgi:hypothetical protein
LGAELTVNIISCCPEFTGFGFVLDWTARFVIKDPKEILKSHSRGSGSLVALPETSIVIVIQYSIFHSPKTSAD